jgi:ABC-type transport system involved in multi-copper enzyme maturation permease subunit
MIALQSSAQATDKGGKKRTFLWKEWRENRLLILVCPLLYIVFVVLGVESQPMSTPWVMDPAACQFLLIFMLLLSAVLTGAAMAAGEIGAGTLGFLTSLPMSRNRIYWTKTGSLLAIHLLSAALTVLAYTGIVWTGSITGVFTHQLGFWSLMANNAPMFLLIVGASITIFFAASMISMLTDRPVVAVIVSIITTVIWLDIIFTVPFTETGWMHEIYPYGAATCHAAFGLIALYAAYQIFVHGESLRTSKRFHILWRILLLDIGLPVAAIVSAFVWLMH